MTRQQFSVSMERRDIRPVPPDIKTAKTDNIFKQITTIKTEQQIFKIFTRR